MIKNILIYIHTSDKEFSISSNLTELDYHCVEFAEGFQDEHNDADFVMKLLHCMRTENIDLVLSKGYFPLLATACEMQKTPYAAWIYDLPDNSLLSKTVLYQHNYLFCFDSVYAQWLLRMGCCHVFHFPLAVDTDAFAKCIQKGITTDYIADISYVGSLHSAGTGWLDMEGIPEYAKGYISGIEEAQIRVYGYNFVKEMISDEMARDIQQKAGLQLGDMYFDSPTQRVADLINQEITQKERMQIIKKLSENHQVHLYTDSHYEGMGNIKLCSAAGSQRDMASLFQNSKINLNITSKTIEAGIPQKVLDILACGGFCISNYQTETADFFEDGKELVMYTDMEDLTQKVEWYLRHDEERAAIARAGCRKVKEHFSMRERLKDMLKIIVEDLEWEE